MTHQQETTTPKEAFIYHLSILTTCKSPHDTLFKYYENQINEHFTSININDIPIFGIQIPFLEAYHEFKAFCKLHLEIDFNKDKLYYNIQEIYHIFQKKLLNLFIPTKDDDLETLIIKKTLNERVLWEYHILQDLWTFFVEWIWNISNKDVRMRYLLQSFIFNFISKIYSMDWSLLKETIGNENNINQNISESSLQNPINQTDKFSKFIRSESRKNIIRKIILFLKNELDLSLPDILEYKENYDKWMKEKDDFHIGMYEDLNEQQLEEYNIEDSSFLLPIQYQYPWNEYGIGSLLFVLFVEHIESNEFIVKGLFDPYYYFMHCSGYITELLKSQTAQFAFIGLYLSIHLLKEIPSMSLQIITNDPFSSIEFHFKFTTSLVNFMASCPEHEPRTKAFEVLNDYINKFNDEGRMKLLQSTISECPFPSLLGLLLSRLKDEICKEYNALLNRIGHPLGSYTIKNESIQSQTQSQSQTQTQTATIQEELSTQTIFTLNTSTVLNTTPTSSKSSTALKTIPPVVNMKPETIEQLQLRKENIIYVNSNALSLICTSISKFITNLSEDSVDVLLHGLNTYYFLLLRDSDANLSKIRTKKSVQEWNETVLHPLKESIQKVEKHMEEIYNLLQTQTQIQNYNENENEKNITNSTNLNNEHEELGEMNKISISNPISNLISNPIPNPILNNDNIYTINNKSIEKNQNTNEFIEKLKEDTNIYTNNPEEKMPNKDVDREYLRNEDLKSEDINSEDLSSEDLSEILQELDEEEFEELSKELSKNLSEEELEIIRNDHHRNLKRRKIESSEFAEMSNQSRIQYEMRVLLIKDLVSRIENVHQFYELNYKEYQEEKIKKK